MAANEDKAPYKATVKLEGFEMLEIEGLVERMQQIIISEGLTIDGKVSYDMPLTYRRAGADERQAKLTAATPMDSFLHSIK